MKVRLRASFTVEASFIFPIIILLTAFFLGTSIDLYSEVKEAAGEAQEVMEIDSVEIFRDSAASDK